ncbi:MAG: hypothetical protein QOI34_1663 [Verrucomicrobiota bacterium]
MKRRNSRNRSTAFPAPFVRPIDYHQPNSVPPPFATGQGRVRKRRIFVIKQVRRLPATNAVGGKIRRILIFDNHPDSLRLVYGGGTNLDRDLSSPERASLWELILAATLTFGALMGIFWPLF